MNDEFLQHLLELRSRLLICVVFFILAFLVFYSFSDDIFKFLLQPLSSILAPKGNHNLIYTHLSEAFITYVKVAVFSSVCFCFPIFSLQIWRFVAPGLYKHEKKAFSMLLISTPVMFFLGALFAYYIVCPNAYSFFLSFETEQSANNLGIHLQAKISEYLSFIMRLILAFGISFEMPILLGLLAKVGMIKSQWLLAKWRIAVMLIAILAAIITPPDIFSMFALVLPLTILYFISIFIVKYSEL